VKGQLEGLDNPMVERGIYFEEAVGEFEKRFIKRVLDRANGNQSRAAQLLGIHRNTLSRKIEEYKLDTNGHRRRSRSIPITSFVKIVWSQGVPLHHTNCCF